MEEKNDLIGDAMFEENNNLDPLVLIKNNTIPIKLIWAGKDNLRETDHQFYKEANEPKDIFFIEGTTHDFIGKEVQELLFQETCTWFEKFA